MALQTLDPLGRAGGVLPSADPSALEVAMDRNKQEDELAKGIQAIKAQEKAAAADNKQKEREAAAKRKTALSDKTLWFAHTLEGQKAYSNLINSRAKRFQDYEAGIGTDPYTEGTDAYTADEIEIQAWNQMVSNSDQLKADHAKVKQYIMENRDLYTDDALEKTDEEYANPEYLKNGELPNTLVAMIDLNKAIEAQFGLIEAEVKAWAENAADGGIVSGSRTQVLPQSLKTQAEGMAAMNPNLSAKLGETMGNYTPEKQKAIKALAAANGISETAAVALDLATAKYGATQMEASRSGPNAAGYGMEVDEIGAINFIEKGIGMNDPANKGKTLKEIGLNDVGTVTDFLNNNPELQRFSIDIPASGEIFNGYNGMVYETKEADGKRINRYVAGIVREPKTGNMQVVTVDGTGGTPKVSAPIPSQKFYSEVMDPLAVNSEELDHKKVGYVFQKKYAPIYKQEGNITLPTKGGAWDLNEAGELE